MNSASWPFPHGTRGPRCPRSADSSSPSMPQPSFSIPARITLSAASSPAFPQPSARAASPASRVISAALTSRASSGAPLFPFRPGGALIAGEARHHRAPVADRLVHLRDLPDQITEPLVLRHLPPCLVQFRARPQVPGPRPSLHPPGQVVLRAVTWVIRRRACAVRLPALAAHLIQGSWPEVPDLAQLPVQLFPPSFQFRQLIGFLRHPNLSNGNTQIKTTTSHDPGPLRMCRTPPRQGVRRYVGPASDSWDFGDMPEVIDVDRRREKPLLSRERSGKPVTSQVTTMPGITSQSTTRHDATHLS